MMKKALYAFAAGVLCVTAVIILSHNHVRQGACSEQSGISIGMNLSSLTYWTRELPFVDVAKASMPWVTQNSRTVPGGKNPWDTGLLHAVPVDADGYPLSLPIEVPGAEAPQVVATLMCRSIEGRYPAGRYVCLYDGRGDIGFSLDARVINKAPGRIEIDVRPSPAGILMKIFSSDKDDHIRNIRVIMPGFEASYASLPFNPMFLERLKPFTVIRFMDWQRTNDSIVQHWAGRTRITSCTQADRGGVAIEHMISLCNQLNADPWFCIPHQADQEYIRSFARLARDSLRPGRKVYIEYSNEAWNAMFGQYRWIEDHGDGALSHARKYASFARRAFEIWQEEFGARKGDVIRVISGQHARPAVMEDIIGYLGPPGMDAAAVGGYFGLDRDGYRALNTLGTRAAAHDVMRDVSESMRNQAVPLMEEHARIASRHKVKFITYEAGQSITPLPAGTSPPYRQALWDAQRSPEMYSTYREFIAECRSMNLALFMAYSYVTAQDTKFGSWGHLEFLDQPVSDAPKYRALLDELHFPHPGSKPASQPPAR